LSLPAAVHGLLIVSNSYKTCVILQEWMW